MPDNVTIDFHFLTQIDYFIGLTAEELESLKKYLNIKTAQKGEMFVLEGDTVDSLYFVISGVVKVYKISADGKQQIINIATVGESLNDVSTFDQGTNAANMLAMTPVVLYGIKKNDVSTIITKYPKVALNAIKVLAGRVRRDSMLVETLSFNQVIGRLAKTLLKYYSEKNIFGIKLTQQDLADMIGTSREMVNKSLKLLENNGSIKLVRNGIEIINKNNLTDMTIIHSTPQRHSENPEESRF
jgi:CRP/FNR family cyclic AMP-dependent transcriptional regulator